MKTILIAVSAASLSALAGCSFAARSPEMYRDDTKAIFEAKNNDIRACYDGVLSGTPGVGGKVTITFEWEADEGNLKNVAVDKTNTTAPAPVADCVTKNITNLKISPPDKRLGQGTWAWEFTAPAPPAKS
jgi:hypothetical protein